MRRVAYKTEYCFLAYDLAKQGLTNPAIAAAIGVSVTIVKRWQREKKTFRLALEKGRSVNSLDANRTFQDYVFRQLPSEIKEVWLKLQKCERKKNAVQRMEAILENCGANMRKHLFFHALVCSNFNKSEACRKIGMPYRTYEDWINNDPDFAAIVDQFHIHKKNFFESALVQKVKDGDSACIMYANRTQNRDRGYNEKIDLEVNGRIEQAHMIDLSSLNLPIEVLDVISTAIEKHSQRAMTNGGVVDAVNTKILSESSNR